MDKEMEVQIHLQIKTARSSGKTFVYRHRDDMDMFTV
jgi:hypothetical protein